MFDPITDQEMRRLRIIDIGQFPPPLELEEKICRGHDISLRSIVDGERIFIDTDMGYLILSDQLLGGYRAAPTTSYYFNKTDQIFSNWKTSLERDTTTVVEPQSNDGHVRETDVWPDETGEGITVAIIDDGIDAELGLLQDLADFRSCLGLNYAVKSLNGHGNKCACIIAGKRYDGPRTAPAPGCRIVAAQANRGGAYNIWLVDLLLMLSWAVFCRQAKIVNMSFTLGATDIESNDGQKLLSRIAKQLRERNQALLFAAANRQKIGYPASLKNVVAAGNYRRANNRREPLASADPSWSQKDELLFAPEKVLGCNGDLVGGSSGACAYISGVAALYLQRYLDKPHQTEARNNTLADVLEIMLGSATLLNPCERAPPRYGIRLP